MSIKNRFDLIDHHLVCECEYCGVIFPSLRPNKYCSNSCKQRAYYVRNGIRKNTGKPSTKDHYQLASNRILEGYKSKISAGVMNLSKRSKTSRKVNVKASSTDKKIDKLERQLSQSELKIMALEEMITLAEYYFDIPIRKKSGAKQ